MRVRGTLVLLALALVVAPAAAQTFVSPAEVKLDLMNDETASAEIHLRNPVTRELFGQAQTRDGVEGIAVQPRTFLLRPNATQTLTVTANGTELGVGEHDTRVRVTLVDRETAATERHHVNVTAFVDAPPLVFSRWENPLPAPADGIAGTFAIEMGAWLAFAYVAMKTNDAVMNRSLTWISRPVKNKILENVDGPLFATLVVAGVRYTWRLLPRSGLVGGLADLLTAALVITAAFLVYRIADSFLLYYGRRHAPQTKARWDDVAIPVLRKVLIAGIGAFGFFYFLQALGLDLGWLVAGGVVIGLVLSNSLGPTLANLFSGLFILMDRPFREGDDIRLDSGEVCRVDKIGLRSTRLYFYRNHEMIIAPNNQLENSRVVNLAYPDRRYRMHLPLSVAYGSPLAEVQEVLVETAKEHPEVLDDEESEPLVFFDEFGDNGLHLRLSYYVKEVAERFRIASELRNRIDKAFRERNITVPFPQRTIWEGQRSSSQGEQPDADDPPEDFDPLVEETDEQAETGRGPTDDRSRGSTEGEKG